MHHLFVLDLSSQQLELQANNNNNNNNNKKININEELLSNNKKKIVSNEEAQQNIIYQPAITKKKLNSENRRGRTTKGEKFLGKIKNYIRPVVFR